MNKTVLFSVLLVLFLSSVSFSVSCGDVLTTSTTLTSDLSCPGTGLTIGADGITLDCQGHTIQGSVPSDGIVINQKNNVVVENCVVQDFHYGIFALNSSSVTLLNNTLHGNGVGCAVVDSNATITDDHYYGNTEDFMFVSFDEDAEKSLTLDEVVFDSDSGGRTSETILSITDTLILPVGHMFKPLGYSISHYPLAPAPPANHTAFDGKYLYIEPYGDDAIESITWQWPEGDTTGYNESAFELWNQSGGSWEMLNDTPDTAANTLSLTNLALNVTPNVFAILQPAEIIVLDNTYGTEPIITTVFGNFGCCIPVGSSMTVTKLAGAGTIATAIRAYAAEYSALYSNPGADGLPTPGSVVAALTAASEPGMAVASPAVTLENYAEPPVSAFTFSDVDPVDCSILPTGNSVAIIINEGSEVLMEPEDSIGPYGWATFVQGIKSGVGGPGYALTYPAVDSSGATTTDSSLVVEITNPTTGRLTPVEGNNMETYLETVEWAFVLGFVALSDPVPSADAVAMGVEEGSGVLIDLDPATGETTINPIYGYGSVKAITDPQVVNGDFVETPLLSYGLIIPIGSDVTIGTEDSWTTVAIDEGEFVGGISHPEFENGILSTTAASVVTEAKPNSPLALSATMPDVLTTQIRWSEGHAGAGSVISVAGQYALQFKTTYFSPPVENITLNLTENSSIIGHSLGSELGISEANMQIWVTNMGGPSGKLETPENIRAGAENIIEFGISLSDEAEDDERVVMTIPEDDTVIYGPGSSISLMVYEDDPLTPSSVIIVGVPMASIIGIGSTLYDDITLFADVKTGFPVRIEQDEYGAETLTVQPGADPVTAYTGNVILYADGSFAPTSDTFVTTVGPGDTIKVADLDDDGVPNYDDACPLTPGTAEREGCPYADKNYVKLHIIDMAKRGDCDGRGSCTKPLENAQVRVFDRNDVDFQALWTKNPPGTYYDEVFNTNIGRVGSCTTDANGYCAAGEKYTGDFLVIVKHFDLESGKTVYTGLPKGSGDFVDGVATKEFQMIKVIRKDGTISYKGGKKTVVTGSALEIISPESVIWEGTEELYPFIFTSDSDWSVDVCMEMPSGYDIAGIYDENDNLVGTADCSQAFVSGESKVIAFRLLETGSPEPKMKVKMKVKGPKGQTKHLDMDIDGIKKATKKAKGRPFRTEGQIPSTTLLVIAGAALALLALFIVLRKRRRR